VKRHRRELAWLDGGGRSVELGASERPGAELLAFHVEHERTLLRARLSAERLPERGEALLPVDDEIVVSLPRRRRGAVQQPR
jgi:hypothetical protein